MTNETNTPQKMILIHANNWVDNGMTMADWIAEQFNVPAEDVDVTADGNIGIGSCWLSDATLSELLAKLSYNGADDPCCGLRIGDRVVEINTSTDDTNPPALGTVVALHADRGSVTVEFSGTDVEIDIEDVTPVGGW